GYEDGSPASSCGRCVFAPSPRHSNPMSDPTVPHIPALELARCLDHGERVQLLDVRAPELVAQARVTFGATLDFRAVPASEMYRLATLEPLRLDPGAPVPVLCSHGHSEEHTSELQS